MLKITNTLTGKKEVFTPIDKDKVKMYVCGITPYDAAHVGHGRVAVVFDVFFRLLKFMNFDVSYCRNYTDIDDKLLKKAELELGDSFRYKDVAEKYIKMFEQDVDSLGCLRPTFEPRVTENIDDIINFIQDLVHNGAAYVSEGDVYFSVKSFPNYGKLSKRNLDELLSGARVEVSEIKMDPLDFALWKSSPEGTFWHSPWGWGRPGWHIECSVLANKFLGQQIDIHGGGMDLIFPHHENEVAQSEARNKKSFVNYWIHNAFVVIDKEKMSKSLGNFFTLRQVFEHFEPRLVRYYILKHHYRAPLDFSFGEIEASKKSFNRIANVFCQNCSQDFIGLGQNAGKNSCCCENGHEKNKKSCSALVLKDIQESKYASQMLDFLLDDLNTSGMFGVLFENLNEIKNDEKEFCAVKILLTQVLGLVLEPLPEKEVEITPEIQKLIENREQARKDKNWVLADEIRDKLLALGVTLQDKKLK